MSSLFRHLIVQGVVPDYRLPLFREIAERMESFGVLGGADYFAPTVLDAARGSSWHCQLGNRFFAGRRLLWQSGLLSRGVGADVVIMEMNPRILSNWIVAIIRAWRRRRTVFWGHVGRIADRSSALGRLRLMMLEVADGFVAYTQADAALLRSRGYRKPIWVAHNSCLYRSQCSFAETERRSDVVYVGRLVHSKKVHILVRAFAIALARLAPGARLIIIGDGPERNALESLVHELGIGDRTEFRGHRSDTTFLRETYSHAFLAASPGYVGLSVIQALGNGVPVLVARDEPHSPEIEACEDEVNAVFFNSDSVDAAADQISRVWNQRARWEGAGAKIAAGVRDRYTYDAMAGAIVNAMRGGEEACVQLVL